MTCQGWRTLGCDLRRGDFYDKSEKHAGLATCIRIKAHISQAVFAAHLNVTPGVVSKWERGEKQPSGSAAKLLQACDLGVESGEKCGDIHVGFSVRRPGEGWWKVRVPYALPASRKKEAALAAPWARPIRRRGWLLQLPLS